jgi:hypothetical protein
LDAEILLLIASRARDITIFHGNITWLKQSIMVYKPFLKRNALIMEKSMDKKTWLKVAAELSFLVVASGK